MKETPKRICIICNKEYIPNTSKQMMCSEECRKIKIAQYQKEYREAHRKEKLKKKEDEKKVVVFDDNFESDCDNECPKDCRFKDIFSGRVHYCNYSKIAFDEGKIDKPIRPCKGGSNCEVYEPLKGEENDNIN